jgi:diguanylate cyclase (GGDEF)-like protein
MATVLRLLWVSLPTAAPAAAVASGHGRPSPAATVDPVPIEGILWIPVVGRAALDAALTQDPLPDAVLLVVLDAASALRCFEWPDAALARCTVLVLPMADDAASDRELYASGVQDVLDPRDLNDALPRRVAAAIARKQLELASQRAYATDPLTGLVNRQQLVEHLSHLLAVRAREPAPIGIVVLQVGPAQPVQGSVAQDQALLVRRKIGVRLRAGVRASDVVASIGADCYAVMLSSIDSPADTKTVATKLAVALRHPFTIGGQALSVPVSVGHAVAPEDGNEPEPLLRRAAQRITSTAFNPRHAANDP